VSERRRYNKVRRAVAEEETRTRIVDALLALHEEIGPARTTVSAIAARAAVERLTVYRHFPDELSMLRACSTRWAALHPLPSLPTFRSGDPLRWCGRVLERLYAWYRENQKMLTQVSLDAERVEAVRALFGEFRRNLDALASTIDRAWPRRNARRLATIRHALELATWRSLSRITGSDRQAVRTVVSWLE
jgi:AcrR family transcriptional regulator